MAPFLGVALEELLQKAGYIEEVIDHKDFSENIYKDEDGNLIDITRQIKEMYEKDSNWANLAYKVASADLSEIELNIIKVQTDVLLEQFIKNKDNAKK